MRMGPVVPDERIIEYIDQYWSTHREGPSLRDVQQAMGFKSSNTAHYRLDKLMRKGKLWQRRKWTHRAYAVIHEGDLEPPAPKFPGMP